MEKLNSYNLLTEYLAAVDAAAALADKNNKIIWFTRSFKELVSKRRLKGVKIERLFNLSPGKLNESIKNSTPFEVAPPKSDLKLFIVPMQKKGSSACCLLRIERIKKIDSERRIGVDILQRNMRFQQELQNILISLVKEKDLKKLASEILAKSILLSGSSFGIAVLLDDKKIQEIIVHDPGGHIKNSPDLGKELHTNFPFITKWLNINKTSLIGSGIRSNIAFNLVNLLQCESLVISPCFFNGNLLATIIIGREAEKYSDLDVSNLEQFAALLSFAVSSIRTRELNAALENRLLQSQKLETIGKLSSGMAHDFSNLLSSIFGSLNLLKRKVPPKEDILRLLENIEASSVRAKDLTKGLLSFGKPTPKRKELIKTNKLLTELYRVVTQTFKKTIAIEYSIEENLHDILGNSTEIYQVLLNLCINAKEAIEGNGTITISAQNFEVDEENIFLFPFLNKGNYVKISVHDTGTGIAEENLTKIFDPYFSTKQKETGSGLGLYVTYGIIKAHGGYIDISSKVNEGTAFDVYLPAYEIVSPVKKAEAEKIILLADDEIMLRDLLAELLESYGYAVIKVSSGVETIKILSEEIKVDMVIIDYNMPEMNGIDCIKKIRELKFRMPVILATGSLSFEEKGIDIKNIGINSILPKPYEFETMLATIQKLL